MTGTVSFDTAVGGDGSTVTDDNNVTTGLGNGGFWTRLVPMFTQMIAVANWVRTTALALQSYVATSFQGGATTFNYTFSTTTTDADPGNGTLRLGTSSQKDSVVMRLDLLDAGLTDVTTALDSLTTSTSVVKGSVRLTKVGDPTKWLLFNVTAEATPSGYRNFTVANAGYSTASPFTNGDSIMFCFTRTGDKGAAGSLVRRTTTITSSSTPTPNVDTEDVYIVSALAAAATFGAPTGTPVEATSIMYRLKDNGTPRALAWNTIFRASSDLPLPTSTVAGKWLYVGVSYNAIDSKYDLTAVLGNI